MSGSHFLGLDPAAAPIRCRTSWLVQQVRAAIADGTLAPGARLPASRSLAQDLSLSRGTVVEAYRRLGEEGLVATNRGGGTVVSGPAVSPATIGAAPAGVPLNISAGVPDLSAFPRAAWLRAERRVLSTATDRELGYADPQGAPALRAALAGWLARSRGVAVEPDRIIVSSGVTGALSLLAQVLRARGMTEWAMEDPGAHGNRRILEHWLNRLRPVPVDPDGLVVEALAGTRARAVLVTPAHQFPTGVVLTQTRRQALVEWASEVDGLVIEDDYDSEYRYDRAPVRAMHALAPERIVHVSSLSKLLAPALRIGWLVAPERLHDDLVRQRWATDLGSPVLPQLALADLIDSGVLERQLRSLRRRHQARRDAAVAAIGRHLPGCRVSGIAAGLHLVVWLPDGVDDTDLAARAAGEGLTVYPVSAHRFAPGPPGLVIGYGPHPTARLEQAIEILARVLDATP